MQSAKLEIKYIPIEVLEPYDGNARTHTEAQVIEIADSIKKKGWTNPILLDGKNGIVAGHGRLLAAKRLGLSEVPTIDLSFKSDAEKAEYIIADNQLALKAGWDFDILNIQFDFIEDNGGDLAGTGFDKDDIDDIRNKVEFSEGLTDPDEVPEVGELPISKEGDIWVLGNHRLMCGDSTMIDSVEKLMAGNKADLWLTDPPYGVSYADKNKFLNAADKGNRNQNKIENDHHSLEEMTQFWKSVASNTLLVTSDKCSYYWFACQGGDQMMMMIALSESQWKVRHELIWVKNNHVLGRCDYHYKHEPILYGWKKDGTHEFFGDSSNFSVLNFDKPTKSEMHPTMKPVELLELLITNNSKNGYLVIDTFGGSGTTLIACEKTNRKCFMMEIRPAYCDVIVKRWQKFTGKEAIMESTRQTFGEVANGQ